MDFSNWEADVSAYEAQTAPVAPIVFYGSSTMRLWDSLSEDFPGKPLANRGFGGSITAEAAHFVPRLILPLKPSQIVFYSGENDLGQGRPVEQIKQDYRDLLAAIRSGSDAPVLFLSIKPSPSRWALKPQMDEINAWLREQCERDASLTYVDVVQSMLRDGKPRMELWVEDGVHLSPAGYQLWADILRPFLV